ncbi:hypothetical protein JHK87_006585 [Glycine soja]|nr:hypothetical protein JHK87_006585 [Glycine soja]
MKIYIEAQMFIAHKIDLDSSLLEASSLSGFCGFSCPLGVVSTSSSVLHKAVGFGRKYRVSKWVVIMAATKPKEINIPPLDQLQGLEYCIHSNPSWGMTKYCYGE